MREFKKKMEALSTKLFEGEVTFDKTTLWLVGLIIFLLGVLYGLLKAPMTHGINIKCGNNNGNTMLPNGCDCDCDEDGCECVGCQDLDDEE